MKEIEDGHVYELDCITDVNGDGKSINADMPVAVAFMRRADGKMIHNGTTNEEVLKMMIARMQYLQNKLPCRENAIVITKLEEALMWLEKRTQKRVEQGVETKDIPHNDK